MSPKYRQLHSKIVDSIDFNDMPDDFTRLVWVLLSLALDGEGRGIDSPAWVRAKLFPLRADVDLAPICTALDWMGQRGMVYRYEVAGKRFFCVPTWKQYQSGTEKEARSTIPAPSNNETNSGVGPELVRSGSGVAPEKIHTTNQPTNQRPDSNQHSDINQLSKENNNNNGGVGPSLFSSFTLQGDLTPDIEKHFSDRVSAYGQEKVFGYLGFAERQEFSWSKARGVDIRKRMVATWEIRE